MRKKYARRALASTPSLLALSIALPAAAQAQAPDTTRSEDLDEIVVTGLIGSLQRNLDMKRESLGVVDVISAEDIGKFPDSNVAASLQRVPGVSIQRSGTRGEPTGITCVASAATSTKRYMTDAGSRLPRATVRWTSAPWAPISSAR